MAGNPEGRSSAGLLASVYSKEVDKFGGSVAGGTGKDAGCNVACDLGLRLWVLAARMAPAEIQASNPQPPEY